MLCIPTGTFLTGCLPAAAAAPQAPGRGTEAGGKFCAGKGKRRPGGLQLVSSKCRGPVTENRETEPPLHLRDWGGHA